MQLINNFNGGVTGNTITTSNSGTSFGDAFTFVLSTVGTGNILQYANVGANSLNRSTAEYVMAFATGSSPGSSYVGWNTLGNQAQIWSRFYVYFTSVALTSPNDFNLMSIYQTSGTTVSLWLRTITSPICLQIYNENSNFETNMVSTPIVANTWNRIEFRALLSTTVGSSDLYLYAGSNSESDTYTDHISQSNQNYGLTQVNTATLGQDVIGQPNTPTMYFSNWEVNNTGYPGPAPFRQGLGYPAGNLTNPIAIHMA